VQGKQRTTLSSVGECIIIHAMRVCISATGLPVEIYLITSGVIIHP